MQVSFSRKADYSVRAMVLLARKDSERRVRARVISAEMEIPYKFLTQILADLVASGLLNAKAGPAGGYLLAREAVKISLLEIIEAAEGPVENDSCALSGGPCHWERACPIHDTWSRAISALRSELASKTLAELAAIDAAIEAGTHTPQFPPHRGRATADA